MLLACILSLMLFQDADSKGDLWDTYQANKESIDEYAATLDEPVGDKELIEGWEKSQPETYSGLRDRRKRRKRKDRTPDENQQIDDWEEDKPSIWDRRKKRQDHRFERRDKFITAIFAWAKYVVVAILVVAGFVACTWIWGLRKK